MVAMGFTVPSAACAPCLHAHMLYIVTILQVYVAGCTLQAVVACCIGIFAVECCKLDVHICVQRYPSPVADALLEQPCCRQLQDALLQEAPVHSIQ